MFIFFLPFFRQHSLISLFTAIHKHLNYFNHYAHLLDYLFVLMCVICSCFLDMRPLLLFVVIAIRLWLFMTALLSVFFPLFFLCLVSVFWIHLCAATVCLHSNFILKLFKKQSNCVVVNMILTFLVECIWCHHHNFLLVLVISNCVCQ